MKKQTRGESLRSKMPVVEPVVANAGSFVKAHSKLSSIWEVTEEYGGSFCGCGCGGCLRVSRKARKN